MGTLTTDTIKNTSGSAKLILEHGATRISRSDDFPETRY